MLNENQLSKIKLTLSRVTRGPWELEESDEGHEIRMGEAIDSGCYSSHMVIEYNHGVYPEDGEQFYEAEANAHLIANASMWLELLIKENDRLIELNVKQRQEANEKNEKLRKFIGEQERCIQNQEDTIAKLNVKLKNLEASLLRGNY